MCCLHYYTRHLSSIIATKWFHTRPQEVAEYQDLAVLHICNLQPYFIIYFNSFFKYNIHYFSFDKRINTCVSSFNKIQNDHICLKALLYMLQAIFKSDGRIQTLHDFSIVSKLNRSSNLLKVPFQKITSGFTKYHFIL